ncbi:MAG: phosphodiesterase, MJ0936 family protein [Parcubacteria group bacterium GW2011_GWE2_38_18]|nr:MAG: phosphodiesterase, MJ0936 family protein [Parcubacteria group bacterium GW2011_GWE2_38_18]
MKIAIMADVHDNFNNLVGALNIAKRKKVKQIIFLGDFCCNGIAKLLAAFDIPVHAIWGNNDGAKGSIMKTSLSKGSNLSVKNNIYDVVEFNGRKIFISHYHDIVKSMAKSGDFDAIFYGHDHNINKEMIGKCLVLNPGDFWS